MDGNSGNNVTPKRKKESNKNIYLLLFLFLLISNAFWFYIYNKTEGELTGQANELKEDLVSVESEKKDLETTLKERLAELETYKGSNDSLNTIIDQKAAELRQKAAEIEALIRNRKISAKELERVRNELDVFKYYAKKYLKQIDSLTTENTALRSEREKLRGELVQEKRKGEEKELDAISAKNQLKLAKKLATSNIVGKGVQIRSGKERDTYKSNKVEQLRVTFFIADNPVAEKGKKDVFLKIIGPDNATMYEPDAGSGKFKIGQEESFYTVKKIIDFDNGGDAYNMYFKKGGEYNKGRYRFELYCEGFLIGTSSLELK